MMPMADGTAAAPGLRERNKQATRSALGRRPPAADRPVTNKADRPGMNKADRPGMNKADRPVTNKADRPVTRRRSGIE